MKKYFWGTFLVFTVTLMMGIRIKNNHRQSTAPTLETTAMSEAMQGAAPSSSQPSLSTKTPVNFSSTFAKEEAARSISQSIPPELQATYQQVSDFARSGEVVRVTNLTTADIHALAAFIARHDDRSQILALIQNSFQMPADLVPEDAENLTDFIGNWFEAVRGDQTNGIVSATTPASPVILPVGFSATTDDSGRIMATAASFPTGVQKIYGVFENRWWPAGLSQVLAVWRNNDQNTVVFQQTEPILTAADSNYVWLFKPEGWSPGHWQLDLFDPTRNFTLLATGTFTIQ